MKSGLAEAQQYIRDNNLGDYLEKKPVSLAIHFRGIKEIKALEIKEKISHNWERIITKFPLVYSEFDGGLELKFPGFNKGDVVSTILADYPVNPSAAYLGDDLTDEDAFKALPENALGILVRPEYRETAANTWIKPPDELLEFLDQWLANGR
jgi:trehalose 6-phosphate phosphatase